MFGQLRRDYVSLNVSIDSPEGDKSPGEYPRRSIWRWWNSLSRFQRSVLYMLVIIALTVIIFTMQRSASTSLNVQYQHPSAVKWEEEKLHPMTPADVHQVEERMRQQEGVEEVAQVVPVKWKEVLPSAKPSPQPDETINNSVDQIWSPPGEGVKFPGPSNARQSAVLAAFRHAWKGYRQFAWGHDHLLPISGSYQDWFGLGLTIVDSLDTLYIMGLKEEFTEARDWVASSLHFNINREVNLFEVTIRVLGSLLSTYHLSADAMFLDKAVDLGTRLLPCFSSDSGVPYSDINLSTRKARSPKWSPDSSTSEVTTIQLEFRDLSRSSGDPRFEELAARVSLHVHHLEKTEGLVPIFINANTGRFRSYSTITMGARGDSYYEYLLKQWIQTGRHIDYLRDDYLEGINGAKKLLTMRTLKSKYLFMGELVAGGRDFRPKMDHLVCYLPGTLALGVHNGLPQEHMHLAQELLHTCFQTYAQQPTFLAPEITYFNIQNAQRKDFYVKINDAHNLLRPEFVESLWYMYQVTGNRTYQEWGWKIFQAVEKHAKVPNGYTSLGNVCSLNNTRPRDMMESFFLSETLKYLYLLFADDPHMLSLDQYVLNSEAHPLPIYSS